jgi:tetratricopeptide (TPR) repeat protein
VGSKRNDLTVREAALIILTGVVALVGSYIRYAPLFRMPHIAAKLAARRAAAGPRFARVEDCLSVAERSLPALRRFALGTVGGQGVARAPAAPGLSALEFASTDLKQTPSDEQGLRYEVLQCRTDYLKRLAVGASQAEMRPLLDKLDAIARRYAPTEANRKDLACVDRLMGSVWYQLGDVSMASEFLRQAVRDNPKDAFAQLAYGVVLERMGSEKSERAGAEAAIPYYERAVRLDPRLRDASLRLGLAYDKLDKRSEAVKALRRAARLGSADAKALLQSWGVPDE